MRRLVPVLAVAALAAVVGGTSALGVARLPGGSPANSCLGGVNRESLQFLKDGLPTAQVCLLDSCPDPRSGLAAFRTRMATALARSCSVAALAGLPASACRGAAGGDVVRFADCISRAHENAVVGLAMADLGCRGANCVPSPTVTPTPSDSPSPGNTATPSPSGTPSGPPCQPRIDGQCASAQNEGCCDASAVCLFNVIGRPRRNGYCARVPGIEIPTCTPNPSGGYGSTCKAFVGGTTASLLD